MKKRITVFILLIVMMIGVFGSVSVYAAEFDSDVMSDFEICKEYGFQGLIDYTNSDGDSMSLGYSFYEYTGDFTFILKSNLESGMTIFSFVTLSDTSECSLGGYGYLKTWGSHDFKSTTSYDASNNVFEDSISGNSVNYAVTQLRAFTSSYTDISYYNSFVMIEVDTWRTDINSYSIAYNYWKTGKFDLDYVNVVDPSARESAEYNADLGYLQNIACTTLVKKDGNEDNTSNEYAGEKKYKFSYGLTTSTGFDLRSDGADVEYCIKIKGGYTTLLNDYVSLPTVVSDYYSVGNGISYFYLNADTLNDLYSLFRTDASLWAKTIDSQIYIYMRPVFADDSGLYYGGWSRILFDKGNIQVNELTIDNGTSSDGKVSSEADGEEDDFVIESTSSGNSSYGEGSDFEDAESNASNVNTNTSNSDVSADELIAQTENLVRQVGEIPQFIGTLFSFLPSWCLTLFGVGFGLIVLLIIYKLVRG